MQNEKVFSYTEWQDSMQRHREMAIADTMNKVRKEFELEIQGLEIIAETCKDELAKERLNRRIARMRRILSK